MNFLPNESSFSISKGMYFVYKDEQNTIHAWSSIGGKEYIYLNGELIHKTQNYDTSSEHIFTDKNDSTYKVKYIVNFSNSLTQCQIFKDGNLAKTFMCQPRKKEAFNIKRFSVLAISLFALTILKQIYTIKDGAYIILLILGFLMYTRSLFKGRFIIIER